MSDEEWDIPPRLQPNPERYAFDLERALSAMVGLRVEVPADAFTAGTLGTERSGSGIAIAPDPAITGGVTAPGLIATIGYLVTEAETVWITTAGGRAVPGDVVGFDGETGFGLVQALGRLDGVALELGDSDAARVDEPVLLAAFGGRTHAIETRVTARQEFAGYWEYLLEDAVFVTPAHPFWGGTGMIGRDGRLLGVGSLNVQQSDPRGRRTDVNMVVPINRLKPIVGDLLRLGRVDKPPRPWIGIYAAESDDAIVVGGLAERGPAKEAGVRVGDRLLAVNGKPVQDLADLWRGLWSSGAAGSRVVLLVQREQARLALNITSGDRKQFLRGPKLH
jgi:S1-C subfamily serine protease